VEQLFLLFAGLAAGLVLLEAVEFLSNSAEQISLGGCCGPTKGSGLT
jgi:hypothetical protein